MIVFLSQASEQRELAARITRALEGIDVDVKGLVR
jgi:hypothetical protein